MRKTRIFFVIFLKNAYLGPIKITLCITTKNIITNIRINNKNMKRFTATDFENMTEPYLKMRFDKYKKTYNGFVAKCPFTEHENDNKTPTFNIRKDGVYYCFKCHVSGNLITLAKYFDDDLRKLF